jgi:hypothetical protein
MKKLFFILLASTTFAALPPLAQSTRELQALLADHRLYESLGSAERIKEILRTEHGYLVLTENYALRVDIQYGGGHSKVIGPIHFEFNFHSPADLKVINSVDPFQN